MGKRNYSGYNNRNNAGREAARNIGVVLALGGLSFFLGFYVLARMVPDKHDASGLQPASASVAPPHSTHQTASSVAAAPSDTPADTPIKPRKSVNATPTLEPGDEPATQTPGKIDSTTQPSANNLDTVGKSATSPTEPALDADSTSATTTPPRKGRRVRSGDSESTPATDKTDTGGIHEGDQQPSKIDREEPSTEAPSESTTRANHVAPADSETPKPEPRTKHTRYRVQGSTHSRLESANREARRITDLGLEAVVVTVTTEDGTTVYRVQQGVYRSRANAEAAKQKLKDADIEASIVKTNG